MKELLIYILYMLLPLGVFCKGTTFIIEANNVNIRASPTTKGQSLGKIPKLTMLHWLDSVQTTDELIDWNGSKIKGKWYKIGAFVGHKSIDGWIFEKAFDFENRVENYYYSDSENQMDYNIPQENENFKTELSTKDEFNQLKNKQKTIVNKSENCKKNSTYSFPILNGGFKTYKDNTNVDDDTWLENNYLGECKSPNVYVLDIHYYEESDFVLINKENGIEFSAFDFSPMGESDKSLDLKISPDSKTIVLGREDGYETSAISFVHFEKGKNKVICIEVDRPLDFRWIDSTSGIAYLEESDYKGGTKKSYLKFTLK